MGDHCSFEDDITGGFGASRDTAGTRFSPFGRVDRTGLPWTFERDEVEAWVRDGGHEEGRGPARAAGRGRWMSSHYHSHYWAHALLLKGAGGSIENLSRAIANACVDLNPHQVDAALSAVLARGSCSPCR